MLTEFCNQWFLGLGVSKVAAVLSQIITLERIPELTDITGFFLSFSS